MGDARPRGSYTFANVAKTSRFMGVGLVSESVFGNCTEIVSASLFHLTPNSLDSFGLNLQLSLSITLFFIR